MLPPSVGYIFGAGHGALNIYKGAHFCGFEVVVVDDREAYANRERFPLAHEVYADDFERVMAQLTSSDSSFLVIATRGHHDDMRVLRWAAQTNARYIGMIGSQRKAIKMFRELENEGIPRKKLERVHSPIGLDIGALTPEEIAVSVVAEMIAIHRHCEANVDRMRRTTRKHGDSVPSEPVNTKSD